MIKDQYIVAFLLFGEFGNISSQTIYDEAAGALYNQYKAPAFCHAGCTSVYQQLKWLAGKQGWYGRSPQFILSGYNHYMDDAALITGGGKFAGKNGWDWANYDYRGPGSSLMGRFMRGEIQATWWDGQGQPYLVVDTSLNPPFMVLTYDQNVKCGAVDCMGNRNPLPTYTPSITASPV